MIKLTGITLRVKKSGRVATAISALPRVSQDKASFSS